MPNDKHNPYEPAGAAPPRRNPGAAPNGPGQSTADPLQPLRIPVLHRSAVPTPMLPLKCSPEVAYRVGLVAQTLTDAGPGGLTVAALGKRTRLERRALVRALRICVACVLRRSRIIRSINCARSSSRWLPGTYPRAVPAPDISTLQKPDFSILRLQLFGAQEILCLLSRTYEDRGRIPYGSRRAKPVVTEPRSRQTRRPPTRPSPRARASV